MNRETLVEKLKVDVAQGRVVTVAGTGVSVAACANQVVEGFNVATWTGLLRHGVKHCRDIGVADDADVEVLSMQINNGKPDILINAAETISHRLRSKSPGTYRGWLKETIGRLAVEDAAILDTLSALPGVLTTLNYDNLLESATGRRAITWLEEDMVQDVLNGNVPNAVLHLHGWYLEPKSVVLGLSSYLSVKDDLHAKAVLDLFAVSHTLLFVGCGDTVLDPNFTRLIEWGKDALADVAPRHYLLCRESEKIDFQRKLSDAPWLQPLVYAEKYEDLVPFLRGLIPAGGMVGPRRKTAIQNFDMAGYRHAMRKRYGHLKLEEIDPSTCDVRPLVLTGMFIAQNAREFGTFLPPVFELPKELQLRLRARGEIDVEDLDEELIKEHRRAYLDQPPRPILEVLSEPGLTRIVVLGDPGSGKSTLLRYILLQWAERTSPDAARQPLPILIELAQYARLRKEGKADDFLSYLHKGLSVRWQFDRIQLDDWLRCNPSVILFDGLDEIFDVELREEASIAIHRLADEYPLARIVVTSRIIAYQHHAWRDEGFRHFMLQELDETQIAEFLTRWHRSAYEDHDAGEVKRSLLENAICESAAIRQLAGNPLLLTMMAILNRTQDLPRDRAELYEQCARLLLYRWKLDFEKDGDALDFKDKRRLLLRVARAMETSEHGLAGNLIDEPTLEAALADGLRMIPILRPDRVARTLIDQLRGRNFILCSVGGLNYAFVHRTFLEYFCAAEICERSQVEQDLTIERLKTEIYGHWSDETWHEVLRLLAGMLAPKFVAQILEWLLEQEGSRDAYHNIFLAAACVGEVRERSKLMDVEKRVFERTKEMTRHHPLISRYDLYYYPHDDVVGTVSGVVARSIKAIAVVWHSDETRRWLADRARADENDGVRRCAMQELARGWKDHPETLRILKDRAQCDDSYAVRHGALQELARRWKDDPETVSIFKVRARTDEYSIVRESAFQELARSWKDDPETLKILKHAATFDWNWSVRRGVLVELARTWKGNLEIEAFLMERAYRDSYHGVRGIVLQELVHTRKSDPNVLTFLKQCAQTDSYFEVREIAVRELTSRWNEEQLVLFLHDRARSDESFLVRQTALKQVAKFWKHEATTLTFLKDLACTDENRDVRHAASQEVAHGWKDDPDTLAWLKERAQADASE